MRVFSLMRRGDCWKENNAVPFNCQVKFRSGHVNPYKILAVFQDGSLL